MKIKLFNLFNSQGVIAKLAETKIEDGVTAYRLFRNIKNINVELVNVEKIRVSLIEKLGEKKDDNSFGITDQSKVEEFHKQFSEVLGEEIEVNILPINPEKLSGFTPKELMSIEWMFEPEQPPEKKKEG